MPSTVEITTFSVVLSATPTIDTNIFASGDAIGSLLTLERFRPSRTGVVQSITISDLGKQDSAIDVVFFKSNPSATTFTNNATLDIADADITKICGVVSIAASDYADFNDNSVATKLNAGLVIQLSGSDTLYAALVSRGTPTYTSTTDLTVQIGVLLD